MGWQENKIEKYLEQAGSFEQNGNYVQAISYAEKAVNISSESEVHHWIAEYNYHIMRILYDKTVEFNHVYGELLQLRKKALDSEILLNDARAHNVYMKLMYFLVMLRYKDCEKVPQYKELAMSFQHLVEIFKIDELDGIDYFTVSNVALGHYYYKMGNPVSSVGYFEKILERLHGDEKIQSMTFFALVTLAYAYLQKGDMRSSKKLCSFLFKKCISEMIENPVQEDIQRLIIVYAGNYSLEGLYHRAKGLITDCIEKKIIQQTGLNDNMWCIYIGLLEILHIMGDSADEHTLHVIQKLFNEMEEKGILEQKLRSDVADFYIGKALLYTQLDDAPMVMESMNRGVSLYLKYGVMEYERMSYVSVILTAMKYYAGLPDERKLEQCTENAIEQLKRLYSYAEYYTDNVQMEEYLRACDILFRSVYSYYSWRYHNVDAEKCFVYCANYKNTLLSIVRKRNQNIYRDEYNIELLQEMNRLKDKVATLKTSTRGTENCVEMAQEMEKLKDLEYEFSSRHKKNRELEFYSYERIMTNLPGDTALIDMIITNHNMWKAGNRGFDENREPGLCIDVFLLVKKDRIYFQCNHVNCVKKLFEKVDLFNKKITERGKYKNEAKDLCEILFAPFKELLFSISHIYISPHKKLYNIPFELVLESAWGQAIKGKDIAYCQSVRDFFENDYGITENMQNSCIIGGPRYSLSEEKNKADEITTSFFDIEQIAALPYSEYEVKSIGKLLQTSYFTGKNATKSKITSGYSYIHVATHGLTQKIEEQNAWYNSALAFAGVADWYSGETKNDEIGNGLLTAEEISRLNLDTTNLIILSACNSGTSKFTLYEQQSGLHLAFGVAGAKYVISALWNVDDFATAILMKYFYQFLKECKNVPEALAKAKYQLRNVSVYELQMLIQRDMQLLPEKLSRQMLYHLANIPQDVLIYHAPKYWAGFVCYQYKF